MPFIVFKITIACLFKFGGSGLVLASGSPSRSEKKMKKRSEKWKCAAAAVGGAEF